MAIFRKRAKKYIFNNKLLIGNFTEYSLIFVCLMRVISCDVVWFFRQIITESQIGHYIYRYVYMYICLNMCVCVYIVYTWFCSIHQYSFAVLGLNNLVHFQSQDYANLLIFDLSE